jgi:uncharacterized protein YrzB (UPF0473 family)
MHTDNHVASDDDEEVEVFDLDADEDEDKDEVIAAFYSNAQENYCPHL